MATYALTKDKPESDVFTFKGDCCICAKGDGTIRILREMNDAFEEVTNENGIPLEYAASNGLAFNGHLSCDVRSKYKISSTGNMIVTVRAEK